MTKIIITEGITLIATTSTINAYKAEVAEMGVEREALEWLANPANWDAPEYSDIYKDVHGVRPY